MSVTALQVARTADGRSVVSRPRDRPPLGLRELGGSGERGDLDRLERGAVADLDETLRTADLGSLPSAAVLGGARVVGSLAATASTARRRPARCGSEWPTRSCGASPSGRAI